MKTERPFTYKISEAEKICYVTAEGRITLRDCVDLMEESINNPQTRPGYRVLVDLRKMKYDPELHEIGNLTTYVTAKKEYFTAKIAFVTAGHRSRFVVDMFCFGATMGGMKVKRFSDMDEAKTWLDEPVAKKTIPPSK